MNRDLSMLVDALILGSIIVIWLSVLVFIAMKAKDTYKNRKIKM